MPQQSDLQASMAGSALDSLKAYQRETLDAMLLPRVEFPASSLKSALDDIGAGQRELRDAMLLSRVEFPASSLKSALDDIRASQRELRDAMHRPLLDSQAILVDSGQSSFLAMQSDLLDAVRQPWLETPLIVDLPLPEPGIYTQDRQHHPPAKQCATDPVDVTELATSESPVARLVYVQGVFADQFVDACLEDVRCSLEDGRPIAAVDRAHSALHRVLQLLAKEVDSRPAPNHRAVRPLCRFVCETHPLFVAGRGKATNLKRSEELRNIVGDLTQLRNNQSLAHPTDDLPSDAVALSIVRRALAVIYQLAERHSQSIEWSAHDRHRYN